MSRFELLIVALCMLLRRWREAWFWASACQRCTFSRAEIRGLFCFYVTGLWAMCLCIQVLSSSYIISGPIWAP